MFLSFLAEDMQNHPGRLTTLSLALAERIAGLIEDVDVDPGAAIEGSVAV
ncbi:MAG: type II toxin-antitoxin system PrlF family antitoxin [Beijerinckiaceae bacterium]